MNNPITLEEETDYRTKVFTKYFVPQSIFKIGEVVLINNITNLK